MEVGKYKESNVYVGESQEGPLRKENDDEENDGGGHQVCEAPRAPFQMDITNETDSLVACLFKTAQLYEWEVLKQELAAARAMVHEREVRLAALKQCDEARIQEREKMQAKVQVLQHELEQAQMESPTYNSGRHTSPYFSSKVSAEHLEQVQGLQRELKTLTCSTLPQLDSRMDMLVTQAITDENARVECMAGLKRCHEMLQESQVNGEATLKQLHLLGKALSLATKEKESLKVEIVDRVAQVKKLSESLQAQNTLLQDLRRQQSELTAAFEKERSYCRKKDEEVSQLLSELASLRARNLDLSFRLNEAAQVREEGHCLRVELERLKKLHAESEEAYSRSCIEREKMEEEAREKKREMMDERRLLRERNEEVASLRKELQESRLLNQLLSRRTAAGSRGVMDASKGKKDMEDEQRNKKRSVSRVVQEDEDDGEVGKIADLEEVEKLEEGEKREAFTATDPFDFGEGCQRLAVKAPAVQRKNATFNPNEENWKKGEGGEGPRKKTYKKQQKQQAKEANTELCKQCTKRSLGLSYVCQLCLQEVCANCVKDNGRRAVATSRGFVCQDCQ